MLSPITKQDRNGTVHSVLNRYAVHLVCDAEAGVIRIFRGVSAFEPYRSYLRTPDTDYPSDRLRVVTTLSDGDQTVRSGSEVRLYASKDPHSEPV